MELIDVRRLVCWHPSLRYATREMRQVDSWVLHHSATNGGDAVAFSRYNVTERKWPGPSYDIVVLADGRAQLAKEPNLVSYHASQYNRRAFGACLVGLFDKVRPTQRQMETLDELPKYFQRIAGNERLRMLGHREVPGTKKSCPGWAVDCEALRRRWRSQGIFA